MRSLIDAGGSQGAVLGSLAADNATKNRRSISLVRGLIGDWPKIGAEFLAGHVRRGHPK